MSERPILFSAEMVRAIIAGRKTQTRRIGKFQKDDATELGVEYIGHAKRGTVAQATYRAFPNGGSARWALCECPYGICRDRLWVKETFSAHGAFGSDGRIVYRADIPDGKHPSGLDWKPSIFMPRKASRITLEIERLRVERLRDIDADGAEAEGCGCGVNDETGGPVARYSNLWESINGKGSWDANPWVWVVAFKQVFNARADLPPASDAAPRKRN